MGLFSNRRNTSGSDDSDTISGSDSVDLAAMADLWDVPAAPVDSGVANESEHDRDGFDESPTSLFDSPQRRRSTDQHSEPTLDEVTVPADVPHRQPPLPPSALSPVELPEPVSIDAKFEAVELAPTWFEHTASDQEPLASGPIDVVDPAESMPFAEVISPEIAAVFDQRRPEAPTDFDAAFADAGLPRADAEPALPPAPRRRSDLGAPVPSDRPEESPETPSTRQMIQVDNVELDEHGLLEMLGLPDSATLSDVGAAHRRFLAEHDPAAEEDESSRNLQRRIRREANTAYATYRLVKAG